MLSNPIWCVCRVPCLRVGLPSDIVFSDWNLWKRYSGIPETFNIMTREGVSMGYPLRPGTSSLLASTSPSCLTRPNRVHREHILSVSCKPAHPSDRYSSLSGFLRPLGTRFIWMSAHEFLRTSHVGRKFLAGLQTSLTCSPAYMKIGWSLLLFLNP